jgi:hypothetical protein
MFLVGGLLLLSSGCGNGDRVSSQGNESTRPNAGSKSKITGQSETHQSPTTAPEGTSPRSNENDNQEGPAASQNRGGAEDGAAEFETPGGDSSIARFGEEGTQRELEEAATALHGYLDARASGNWARACSYLSAGMSRSLAELTGSQGGRAPACPKLLASLSAQILASSLREAAVADIGALRRQGSHGFLFFHGAHQIDYFIPMVRVGDDWRVAAIAASALP